MALDGRPRRVPSPARRPLSRSRAPYASTRTARGTLRPDWLSRATDAALLDEIVWQCRRSERVAAPVAMYYPTSEDRPFLFTTTDGLILAQSQRLRARIETELRRRGRTPDEIDDEYFARMTAPDRAA